MTSANYSEMTAIPAHVRYLAKQDTPTAEFPVDIKWSNLTMDVPAIGEIVHVRMNSIKAARVEGYFVEHGFLGLLVKPLAPPSWYVKQNGRFSTCHVFGTEVDPLRADDLKLRATVRVVQIPGFDGDGYRKLSADRYTVRVYRNADNSLLLDCAATRTTPELAVKLAEKFCQKNGLVIFAVEFPS